MSSIVLVFFAGDCRRATWLTVWAVVGAFVPEDLRVAGILKRQLMYPIALEGRYM
jgi:hypothetical protein